MNKKKFTYKKSGVNIKAADKFVDFISTVSAKKRGKKKFSNIGGFGSITNIPGNIKQPRIVACTDGVGTKVEIANTLNKFDTIGIDLVAMSVNDLIVQGAKPLLFLDYISINKIDLKKLKAIIKGIAFLMPFIFIAMTIRSLDVARAYDIVQMMTGGGPAKRTELLWTLISRTGYVDAKMGMANAMSYISIVLSIAFTFFFFYKLMEARKVLSYD